MKVLSIPLSFYLFIIFSISQVHSKETNQLNQKLVSSKINITRTLVFESAYIYKVPTTASMSSAYLTIKNLSKNDITIKEITSLCAKNVEFHDMVMENEMMRMKQLNKVTIKAQEKFQFKPRSKHIMLIGLNETFHKQKQCYFELTDENKNSYTFEAKIKQR